MPAPRTPEYIAFEQALKPLEQAMQGQQGMPPPPATALPQPSMWDYPGQQHMPTFANTEPTPIASGGGLTADKAYQYAILASLLGSVGAGIGQAFRPWVKPPQPMPSPAAGQMPITAPAALQALTQTRQARKGF